MSSNADSTIEALFSQFSVRSFFTTDFAATLEPDENTPPFIPFEQGLNGSVTFSDPFSGGPSGSIAYVTTLDGVNLGVVSTGTSGQREITTKLSFSYIAAPITAQAPLMVPIIASTDVASSGTAPVNPDTNSRGDTFAIISTTGLGGPDGVSIENQSGFLDLQTQIDGGDQNFVDFFASASARGGPDPSIQLSDVKVAVDPDARGNVDGANVALSDIFVLKVDDTPRNVSDYPSLAGLIDGFDFDPGRHLNVDGGTVTATGIDEDGFGGNDSNIVTNIDIVVEQGAQVLTLIERPTQYSARDAAIDVIGDNNRLHNNGTINTGRPDNEAVSLVGDGIEVNNFQTGIIVATEDESDGIFLAGNNNALRNEGTIGTTGQSSIAVILEGTSDEFGYTPGADLTVENLGTIEVTNTQSIALSLDGSGESSIANAGTVRSSASELGIALLVSGENVQVVNNDTIETTGEFSPAVVMGGTNLSLLNNMDITTQGQLSAAVMAGGENVSITNSRDSNITTNAPSRGVALQIGGFGDDDFSLLQTEYKAFQSQLVGFANAEGENFAADLLGTAAQNASLTNAGLIEAFGQGDGGFFTHAILANMDGGTLTNTGNGVIRSEQIAMFLQGTGTLENAGKILSRVQEANPGTAATTIIVDGLNSDFNINNQTDAEISGSILFVGPSGSVFNDGKIQGISSVSTGDSPTNGTGFDIFQGENGVIGMSTDTTAVSYVWPNAQNNLTIDSEGDFLGGISAFATNFTFRLGENGTITATGDTSALAFVADATINLEGDITATRGIIQDPNPIGGSESLSLNVSDTGSVIASGQDARAVQSAIEGEINIDNQGLLSAIGANAIAVLALEVNSSSSANIVNGGMIRAEGTGSAAISSGRLGLQNTGTVEALGANATAVNVGPTADIVNSGVIQITSEGNAAIFANGATAQLLGGTGSVDLNIRNTGTISAGSDSGIAIQGEALGFGGDDRIENAGTIIGDVLLTTGTDLFIQNGGTISGIVDGSQGDTTLEARSGTVDAEDYVSIEQFNVTGAATLEGILSVDQAAVEAAGVLTLNGTIDGPTLVNVAGVLQGNGTVNGLLTVQGTLEAESGFTASAISLETGTMSVSGAVSAPVTVSGASTIDGPGGSISGSVTINAGSVTTVSAPLAISGPLVSAGVTTVTGGPVSSPVLLVAAGTTTIEGSYSTSTTQVDGFLAVNGSLISANVFVNDGGVLQGTGVIAGNVVVDAGGIFAPGASPGTLTIEGNLTVNGELQIEVEGLETGTFDTIEVTGDADLSGATIVISLAEGLTPADLDNLKLITSGTVTGLENATVTVEGFPDVEVILDPQGTIEVPSVQEPPQAVDDTFETSQDTPIITDLLANDTDPDGDTISVLDLDTAQTLGLVTILENGDIQYDPDGKFDFLDDNETGADTFLYTISDGQGGQDTGQVTVEISGRNDAPVALDDFFGVVAGSEVNDNVLSNDSDIDGDALTVSLVSGTSKGELDLGSDGSFVFRPDPGASGTDSFVYLLSDGDLSATATANFTIDPLEEPTGNFSFSLVNTRTNETVASVTQGETVDRGSASSFSTSIVADWNGEAPVESMTLSISDADGKVLYSRTENVEPYALFGDRRGDFFDPRNPLPEGAYTITAKAYSKDRAGGELVDETTIDFVIAGDAAPTGSFEVFLVDTASDEVLTEITQGANLTPTDTSGDNLSVRVDFEGAESVRLALYDSDGNLVSDRIENVEPYALFGDRRGDYFNPPDPLAADDYRLEIAAYSEDRGRGTEIDSAVFEFTISEIYVA